VVSAGRARSSATYARTLCSVGDKTQRPARWGEASPGVRQLLCLTSGSIPQRPEHEVGTIANGSCRRWIADVRGEVRPNIVKLVGEVVPTDRLYRVGAIALIGDPEFLPRPYSCRVRMEVVALGRAMRQASTINGGKIVYPIGYLQGVAPVILANECVLARARRGEEARLSGPEIRPPGRLRFVRLFMMAPRPRSAVAISP